MTLPTMPVPAAVPPPPPSQSASTRPSSSTMLDLTPSVKTTTAPRVVFTAVEGWGKTSLGAHAPSPFIMMSPRERGYETLLQHDLVPAVPAQVAPDWTTALAWIDEISTDPRGIKTLVLDALSGFEHMCHDHVCNRDFGGEWSDRGFLSYHQGYDISVQEWRLLLAKLDRLTDAGVAIIILSHITVKPFHNPDGSDYDRYQADCHHKTWGVTNKWADAVLFGRFIEVFADSKQAERNRTTGKGKAKAIGTRSRAVFTDRRDAWDAKNRMNMPDPIQVGDGPAANWQAIAPYLSH